MKLLFVHGWSVTHTNTYAYLPEAIEALSPDTLELEVAHIHLGRYISFHDEVTVEDVARAFEQARREVLGDENFSCITHSTGGPVIRTWVELFYGASELKRLPMKHLIMLAPANHGSALAQLGKSRLNRLATWVRGIEPGERILHWLELGSDQQWALNLRWLDYQNDAASFYPVVLTGQDREWKLYDFLNSYTGEAGTDGVIRVAAANMNYRYIKLRQNCQAEVSSDDDKRPLHRLEVVENRTSPYVPLGIIPETSHTGDEMGIMKSVGKKNYRKKPVVHRIVDTLKVNTPGQYRKLAREITRATEKTQEDGARFSMLTFYIRDDRGNEILDYDMLLLAGRVYSPDRLPGGFFVDRQRNRANPSRLTYYLNYDRMQMIEDGCLGIRILARPDEGFSCYSAAEFRTDGLPLDQILLPNETVLIDVELKRHVDVNSFSLVPLYDKRKKFKKLKPSGENLS